MRKRQAPLRPKPTPAIPVSVFRDRLLETMRRHEPLLDRSRVGMDVQWVRSRNVARVSFDFDIGKYLQEAGDA